jgi:hypothetical protein
MRIAETRRPAHAMTVGDRVGWERSGRTYTARPAARPHGRAFTALRATAYVLTSLASLVFLVLVVLVALRLGQVPPPAP